MKKLLSLILIIVLSLSLISCNKKENLNNKLIEKVKILEENEYKFNRFNITYDEFITNTKNILYDANKYIDDKYIAINKNNNKNVRYKGIDLKGLNIQELNVLKNDIKKFDLEDFNIKLNTEEIKISLSHAYDIGDPNKRVIFGQKIAKIESVNTMENYSNRRYTFKKINGKWKILMIETDSAAYLTKASRVNKEVKEEIINKLNYNVFNEDKIKYSTVYYLKDNE